MDTAEFLAAVLPTKGLRCIALSRHGKPGMKHVFARTNEEAALIALREDAQPDTQVYFACAAYKDSTSRQATNVAAARAFWLDIDCGEGKPYPDERHAVLAIKAFCRAVGLPIPMLVASGTGIHAYWPLSGDLAPDEWRTIATALKRAAKQLGLFADPSRTADITSLLRPAGTHNRKAEPRTVRLLRGLQ